MLFSREIDFFQLAPNLYMNPSQNNIRYSTKKIEEDVANCSLFVEAQVSVNTPCDCRRLVFWEVKVRKLNLEKSILCNLHKAAYSSIRYGVEVAEINAAAV